MEKAWPTLESFGLNVAAVERIVRDAHAQKATVPALAPVTSPGTAFYTYAIVGMREHLLAQGWKRMWLNGLELVESPDGRLRLGYVATDGGTGFLHLPMRSLRERGAMSAGVAERNHQLALLPREQYVGVPRAPAAGAQTWFLAVHHGVNSYRVEIALPSDCAGDHFSSWDHRIVVCEVAIQTELAPLAEPLVPAPKPAIRRKRAERDEKSSRTGSDD